MKPLFAEGTKIKRKKTCAANHVSVHDDDYEIF